MPLIPSLRDILREGEYQTGVAERRNISFENVEERKATPEEQEQVRNVLIVFLSRKSVQWVYELSSYNS